MRDSEHWTAEQIAQAMRVAAGPLGQAVSRYATSFAKAVLMYDSGPDPQVNSATVTLADLSKGPLAVTNWHVLQKFIDRSAEQRMVFQIGACRFDPMPRLRSRDTAVDLVAIALDGLDLALITNGETIGGDFYRPTSDWPPPPPETGDAVHVAAYPADLRHQVASRTLSFGTFTPSSNPVASVSPDHFIVTFERNFWVTAYNQEGLGPFDIRELGGMSGGPVVIERRRSGIVAFDLIGFAENCVPFDDNIDFLRVVSSQTLAADGAVRWVC